MTLGTEVPSTSIGPACKTQPWIFDASRGCGSDTRSLGQSIDDGRWRAGRGVRDFRSNCDRDRCLSSSNRPLSVREEDRANPGFQHAKRVPGRARLQGFHDLHHRF